MEISEVLEQIGLNEKQASVYLALLELGTATVHPIATKANIKRPTAYLILEDLQQKGMVSVIPREKKVIYTAESPEKLIADLNKKQELVKRFMPNMLALYNAKKDKPQVQLFEGKDAVGQIYRKLYLSNEVWFFGTISDITKLYPEEFKIFLERVKNGQLVARDLFINTQVDAGFAAGTNAVSNYQIRFLPVRPAFPVTDFAVSGNNLVFLSFRPQVFAVTISSREVSGTFKTLYEFAWQAAKPLPQEKPILV